MAPRLSTRTILAASVCLAALLAGCEQEPIDEPRGGGYVDPQASKKPAGGSADGSSEPEPEAKSYLGKAKQAAERVINEDVAEYNKKVEQAADDVFKKP
jgi:hypothetical protein